MTAHLRKHRAFTLIELVVSVSLMSILMIGIASALVIASRTLPSEDDPLANQIDAAQAVDWLAGDLMCTVTVLNAANNAVTFSVADRNGDMIPEKLSYSWSGTAGDPLVRVVNSGSAEVLVEKVTSFALAYDTQITEHDPSSDPNESNEQLLFAHDAIDNLKYGDVLNNSWWGQYFAPSLPADAVSWSVSRVRLLLKRHSNEDTTTMVELRLPNPDWTPSDTVIDRKGIPQLSLPANATWMEVVFSDARNLDPGVGLCLALTTTDTSSCVLRYRQAGVVLAGSALSFYNTSWGTPATDQALLIYVYGTVTTPTPPTPVNIEHLVGVRIQLTLERAPDEPIETAVLLLNRPEV